MDHLLLPLKKETNNYSSKFLSTTCTVEQEIEYALCACPRGNQWRRRGNLGAGTGSFPPSKQIYVRTPTSGPGPLTCGDLAPPGGPAPNPPLAYSSSTNSPPGRRPRLEWRDKARTDLESEREGIFLFEGGEEMAVTIASVKARQIFDSRGNPTVEVRGEIDRGGKGARSVSVLRVAVRVVMR